MERLATALSKFKLQTWQWMTLIGYMVILNVIIGVAIYLLLNDGFIWTLSSDDIPPEIVSTGHDLNDLSPVLYADKRPAVTSTPLPYQSSTLASLTNSTSVPALLSLRPRTAETKAVPQAISEPESFVNVTLVDTLSTDALNFLAAISTASAANDSNKAEAAQVAVVAVTPTATATPTSTKTPKPTKTLTLVSTPTATATPSPTVTATDTARPTKTPKPTKTSTLPPSTSTATDTSTPVPTETWTPTPLPTDTATSTATPSITPSPTATPSPTKTWTATPLPTDTAAFTATPTSTATDTSTPVPTETWTPTPLPTDTATSTATPSITPSPTATLTPQPTSTFTHTPTSTTIPIAALTATAKVVVAPIKLGASIDVNTLSLPQTAFIQSAKPLSAHQIGLAWNQDAAAQATHIYSDLGTGYDIFIYRDTIKLNEFVDYRLRSDLNYTYRIETVSQYEQQLDFVTVDLSDRVEQRRLSTVLAEAIISDTVQSNTPIIPAPTPLPPDALLLGLVSDISYVDQLGMLNVVGEVRNDANLDVGTATVIVSFYDTNGDFISEAWGETLLNHLAPGARSPFSLQLKRPAGMSNYSVKALGRPVALELTPQLQVMRTKAYEDQTGFYHVAGEVKNVGSIAVQQSKVIVTLYRRGGSVANVGFGYPEPERLEPGDQASFDITFTYFPQVVDKRVIVISQ